MARNPVFPLAVDTPVLSETLRAMQNQVLITRWLNAFPELAELEPEAKTELLEATRVAEECDIPFDLCDREIRITLLRAWRSMSLKVNGWRARSVITAY